MINKKQKIVFIVLIFLTMAVLIPASFAAITSENEKSKDKCIYDLAELSGLPTQTVIELVYAVGDSEKVKENIFLYKRLFNIAQPENFAYSNLFSQVQEYKTSDLLAVYEFVYEKGSGLDKVEPILKEYTEGKSLDELLSQEMASKEYKVYLPADKDQIQTWLNKGYLPQDIINADNIAMAKDISISDVIALKTDAVTWDDIGNKLGYVLSSENSEVTVNVQENSNTYQIKGHDYGALIKKANTSAEEKKSNVSKQILDKAGITKAQLEEYINQGINIHEVENAFRLSKKSGTAIDRILQDKKEGMSWESIIKKYAGKEGKDTE